MKRWLNYAKPYKLYFILGPICMIVEVLGEVLMPMFLGMIINSAAEGTLTPAFDKDTFSYTAAVGNEVEGVQVKAFFADGITAMLGEEALESGVYSEEIPLQVGENEIVVTLSLEGEESEYVIVVTREEEAVTEPDPTPGTDKPSIPGSDEDQIGGGDWDWPSDSGNGSANGSSSGDKENPSSGDHSMIAGALAVLALSAGAVVVLFRKKK